MSDTSSKKEDIEKDELQIGLRTRQEKKGVGRVSFEREKVHH